MDEKQKLEKLAVSSAELEELLGCGRTAAKKIGEEAGAKIQLHSRVLWNVQKLKEYLNKVSE